MAPVRLIIDLAVSHSFAAGVSEPTADRMRLEGIVYAAMRYIAQASNWDWIKIKSRDLAY
jgi:hypothetical protein